MSSHRSDLLQRTRSCSDSLPITISSGAAIRCSEVALLIESDRH